MKITIPNEPRVISPLRTFEHLVDEMEKLFNSMKCRGAIIGLSGTDSILAFLICEKALRRLGFGDRLVGIHYGYEDSHFAKYGMPWLQKQVSHASLIVDNRFKPKADGARWGDMIDRAVINPIDGSYRPAEARLWVIGSRNRSEDALGMYSNSTKIASAQPISCLWKSEVLDICKALDVPHQIINAAYVPDCGCGDPDMDLIAMNPRLTDVLLMQYRNQLSLQYRYKQDPALIEDVGKAILRQFAAAGFKAVIPYEMDDEAVILRASEEVA